MALITDSLYLDLIVTLPPILYLIYYIVTYNNDYWEKRGVPSVKRDPIFESMIGRKSQGESFLEIYKEFSGQRFGGLFQFKKPVLMILDVDLIHKVLVKDFTHFQDRGQPQFKNDPLSQSLFSLNGQIWKALRQKLTPTFTTGKLRGMFEQITKSGDNMTAKIEELINSSSDVETKSFLFEFTLDVIASCAFGLQFKPGSPEFEQFKETVHQIFTLSVARTSRFAIAVVSPKITEFLGIKQMNNDVTEYFLNLTKVTLKYRKENNIQRNDYFQQLITLKEQEESGKEMGISISDATEDDEVINQMQYADDDAPLSSNIKLMTDAAICSNSFIFLVAGSESTANTISFILLQLAQHPDIQLRLQKEIDNALAHHGGWSYDAVKQMTYLDQVIQETQRINPLIGMLIRECVKPYKVPDSNLVIEKGVLIGVPISCLQNDPQYYPDPETFNPDRFEGNNFKPNPTFMPFGDGPRICIAMRFAVLEVKVCVARIMSQYSVKPSPKMQFPIKMSKRSFVPSVEGGVWLKFERRNGKRN